MQGSVSSGGPWIVGLDQWPFWTPGRSFFDALRAILAIITIIIVIIIIIIVIMTIIIMVMMMMMIIIIEVPIPDV